MTDNEYYQKVVSLLKQEGIEREPDFDTVVDDKYNDLTPEESASEFIEEWK